MKKHTGLDFADMIVEQYGHDALEVALETVRQIHIRRLRQTAGIRRQVPGEDSLQSRIVAATCEYFGIPEHHLKGGRQLGRWSLARRVCWALLRDKVGMTFEEIGEAFNRDHTTVLSALKRADSRGEAYAAVTALLGAAVMSNVELAPGPELELEEAV